MAEVVQVPEQVSSKVAAVEQPAHGIAPAAAPAGGEMVEGFVGAPAPAPAAGGIPFAPASLYVGDLDESITEAMLYELFSIVGAVASIRVCRDAITRRSLGYAYVNYHSRVDGERALETLNYTEIKGKPCRIMWSQRDPSLRKSGQGNIFIKNLDEAIDNKALYDTFGAFGPILSCKVVTDEHGKSRGYGFVHYVTREAADAAISQVNGMLLNEKQVYVGNYVPRRERMSKAEEMRNRFTNIYIKNLDVGVTDSELEELCARFGEISSACVSRSSDGESKEFGFVDFVDHNAAADAVEGLNEIEFHGKKLFVSRAQKKQEREEELKKQYEQIKLEKLNKYQGVNLYIKNFDDDIDDEKLRQEFSVYGVITSAKIMTDESGKSRGFGFVCFSSPDEATKAVTEMNGRMWGNKPIYVALAQRKDQRRNQLEALNRQLRMTSQMGNVGSAMYGAAPMYFPPGQGYSVQRNVPFNPNGMQRQMRWPAGAQPGAQQPFAGGPAMAAQYNVANGYPMGSTTRPSRGRNPRQMNRGAHQGNVRGAQTAARGGYRGSRTAGQTQADGKPVDGGEHDEAQAAAEAEGASVLTAAALAAASPEKQKEMLGEALFPMVASTQPDLAGKITGMLLEMDNSELLLLLDSSSALEAKVNEAMEVLAQSDETTTA
ncbi:Polyadenylate-binding protein, cytoplasmic and nuclear [Zancudomyces culisetae]|uniref:Polyadenylate-binding protein n=1 Tax=Zancudomyces culisetae TaxID=1213189 RepID=A0A1R1PIG6_ZANCU|nr:Polyadenylate-binding protein, cytoplasmic and nuclear [Zancudomyces culisetae]|eukprot:OMH80703.1 Polyadenylate-binding protein, cytoplasmic and nuclear [Zancudomyces culisetae]